MRILISAAAIVLLVAVLPAAAQEPGEGEPTVTMELVQRQRRAVERNSNLSEGLRKQVLGYYDEAAQELNSARRLAEEARRFERERAHIGRDIQALQAELDRPAPEAEVSLPGDASVERIQQQLTQERAELGARRQVLSDLTKLAESRANRRTAIARRIGELNQRLEETEDTLLSISRRDTSPELREAMRAEVLARRQRVQQEIETLREEQRLIDAQAELIPLQRDRAERRVAESERLVEQLEKRAATARRAEAEAALGRVREIVDRAREATAVAPDVIGDTLDMAETLWAEDGVETGVAETSQELTDMRRRLLQIEKISSVTRRKFEAVRTHGIAAQWWPQIPEDIPRPAELREQIRERESMIPNVQHELIVLEEKRVQMGNIEAQVSDLLERAKRLDPAADERELERRLRALISARRDLIDELIKSYTRYADQLIELTGASRALREAITDLDTYIYERVFWVRSVPGGKVPPVEDILGGLRWLVWNPDWGALIRHSAGAVARDGLLVLCLLALPGLVLYRRSFLARLMLEARRASRVETDSFTTTLRAIGMTVLLSAPAPLLFFALSRWISMPADSEFVRGLSGAFRSLALLSATFVFMAEIMRPSGVAEAHFRWPAGALRVARQWVLRMLRVLLPLAFVCLALGEEGLRFHSQPDLRAYSNGLGRICFIAGCIWVTYVAYRILRPQGRAMSATFNGEETSWGSRSRYLWFPLAVVLLIGPAILAFWGYYVTGITMAVFLHRTFALTFLTILVGDSLVRWRLTKEKTLLDGKQSDERRRDLETAHTQIRQLTRFSLALVWVAGTLMIWSSVLPAFSMLDRIQLLPSVEFIREDTARGLPAGTEQAGAGQETPAETDEEAGSAMGPAAALGAAATAGGVAAERALTLAGLLGTLLTLLVTLILARNIPGLMEFTVLQRTPLAPGARAAIRTLVSYIVVIVGVSLAAGRLGLSWEKIQWLAAALTFGLAFGLQEIFANFVSGIIILLDRPIRVGDVITINNIGGWVTKISIRATTITKWDRSELIVPNRDFITQQLTNWTLSNKLTRVELKIGVEYGSDVENVRRVLLDVAHAHPAILKDPPPYTVLMAFGDNAIEFELRIYADYDYGRLTLRDEVQRRIVAAFAKEGIIIAFPQLDLHLKSGLPFPQSSPPPVAPPPATPRGLQDVDD